MVEVQGGTFTYGSSISDKNMSPEAEATLNDFYMDIYEVTNEEYRTFIKETKGKETPFWSINGYDKTKASHPVTFVSLENARAYCQWKGKTLPNEAQWERAASGDDRRAYPWGKEFVKGVSNTVTSKTIRTEAVGTYPEGASPYGVMDLTGNVLEWTETSVVLKDDDYNEEMYVAKGGSWGLSHNVSKNFNRFLFTPDTKVNNLGFRCVKNK